MKQDLRKIVSLKESWVFVSFPTVPPYTKLVSLCPARPCFFLWNTQEHQTKKKYAKSGEKHSEATWQRNLAKFQFATLLNSLFVTLKITLQKPMVLCIFAAARKRAFMTDLTKLPRSLIPSKCTDYLDIDLSSHKIICG